MDLFRKIFGFSDSKQSPQLFDEPGSSSSNETGTFFDPGRFFEKRDDGIHSQMDDPPSEFPRRNFNVFSDPLEIHRYFEEQMDSFFKSFGMPNFGNFFHELEPPNVDTDESFGTNQLEPHRPDSREYFLKKNPYKPIYEPPGEKVDKDMDGKLTAKDIDEFFKKSSDKIVPPNSDSTAMKLYQQPARPFTGTFFNKSVQVKTIRRPDGSFETRRVVTDSEGNEETTITQKLGDKEYTIIKKRDKDGKEEIHENMVNMNEGEKSLFDSRDALRPFSHDSWFSKFFK